MAVIDRLAEGGERFGALEPSFRIGPPLRVEKRQRPATGKHPGRPPLGLGTDIDDRHALCSQPLEFRVANIDDQFASTP